MTDGRKVGVGPHPLPRPEDNRFDRELLANGDRRNVLDEYRYWTRDAIIADLDTKRLGFHVAIENFQHDFNIGTIVRNANAFLAHTVHIVGKRRWNKRGAMVTDTYQHVDYHPTVDGFVAWAEGAGLPLIGIDIRAGSEPIESAPVPERCVLVFGQEGPGLSDEMVGHCVSVLHITQHGSTRSINVGVASGIAMHELIRRQGTVG
ncbi:MAG: rRNA methyltransferase [Acidimicrobiia bacterium]|nr:MAG: rRNA methyltransferase [Acidimicrobiia bacterium]